MPQFNVDLNNHNALITGAGNGIGKAIAQTLAKHGASVAINDINLERAEDVADDINQAGGTAVPLHGDISNRFQVANMIEQARDALGKIHILVNCAGTFKADPMLTIDEWDWRRQIEINTIGTFFVMQLVGRVMADEGGGVMINLASTAANPNPIEAGMGYVAGKSSIIGMTRQVANELAKHQIRVNAICAGNIDEPDMPTVSADHTLVNRIGTPQDIANVALFLCSDAASFITGQALTVDGGQATRQ
jgi:NAD(P)-dependent dehydrogenase (short-subunit alcohol dehydrogenase family)